MGVSRTPLGAELGGQAAGRAHHADRHVPRPHSTTRGSSRIACAMASAIAGVSRRAAEGRDSTDAIENVLVGAGLVWEGRGPRALQRRVELRPALGREPRAQRLAVRDARREAVDRVGGGVGRVGPVVARVRLLALVVAAAADAAALEEGRAVAGARPGERRRRRLVDGQDVVAVDDGARGCRSRRRAARCRGRPSPASEAENSP
jgi:hypothetical protein